MTVSSGRMLRTRPRKRKRSYYGTKGEFSDETDRNSTISIIYLLRSYTIRKSIVDISEKVIFFKKINYNGS